MRKIIVSISALAVCLPLASASAFAWGSGSGGGGSVSFTQPYVLTYPPQGFPTDRPRPQLYVQPLNHYKVQDAAAGSASVSHQHHPHHSQQPGQ